MPLALCPKRPMPQPVDEDQCGRSQSQLYCKKKSIAEFGSVKVPISATAGSESAERAVAAAADIAKAISAKLLIVNISADHCSRGQIALLDRLRVTEGDALDQLSCGVLARGRAIAGDHGLAHIETMTRAGDPAEVLLEIAKLTLGLIAPRRR